MTEFLVMTKSDFICCAILLVIILRCLHAPTQKYTQRIFNWLLVVEETAALCYLTCNLVDSGHYQVTAGQSQLYHLLYLMLIASVSFLWFLYAEISVDSVLTNSLKHRIFSSIPMLCYQIMLICSLQTHWIFDAAPDGTYQSGPLYLLQYIVPPAYLLVTSVHTLLLSVRAENYARRQELHTLAMFIVPPMICAVISAISSELRLIVVGVMLSTLMIYMNSLDIQVSMDGLTGLNNRNQLVRYLHTQMRNQTEGKHLFLLMMDADYFKKINDQYGHLEGDEALMRIAEALRMTIFPHHGFLARYGGDEFIMVCEAESRADIQQLGQRINDNLYQLNKRAGAPYSLQLSIGIAEYTEQICSVADMIHAADMDLYHVKQQRKEPV